jgi:RNA-directed DNA polymerase
MPLGNLTSQFFANIYLNELDQFVKHNLRVKYYIRYVDDFIILHQSKEQLKIWKKQIENFLKNSLRLELHPDKSRIISLSKPIPFVGFRVFYHHKLLKKFNQRNIKKRLDKFNILFSNNQISYDKIYESIQGAFAYAKHAHTYNFRNDLIKKMNKYFPNEISEIEINRALSSLGK